MTEQAGTDTTSFFRDLLGVGVGVLLVTQLLRGYERRLDERLHAAEAILRDCGKPDRVTAVPPSANQLLGPLTRPTAPSGRWLFRLVLRLRPYA